MSTKIINIDPDILSGTPVFEGTRVPVEILFDHLETGLTIDDFLKENPTIKKSQVIRVLEMESLKTVREHSEGILLNYC
ncbi:MAG TPA: DUF433 domain-containing protein [Flammeovirgaceae bacterium]|nr:DUF433 domain-containing protein [Flammeovirgaceae bacterium]